ncbi:MAG: ThiF family adenylyltransferase [Planctomycetota bacterium]|nr:ThiF family adenylyltransferase [Planctomycetota bacterium]
MKGRFDRQTRFEGLGAEGQERLASARVLVVGCGAIGGVLAQTFTRVGVGELVLVDRDVVELTNLPRQVLFEDRHASEGTPKALAAAETLARIGGPTKVTAQPLHLDAKNVGELAEGCDLILDGTDNLATRYLLNDYCVANELPWVYAGVVASEGLVLAVLPGTGPCLRCVFPQPPPAGTLATCDTAGVILPAVSSIASLQAGLGLRILADGGRTLEPALIRIDVWSGRVSRVAARRDPDCPCCGAGELEFLDGDGDFAPVVLCGRNTVQIRSGANRIDLAALAERLRGVADDVRFADVLVRFEVDGFRVSVFRDGRALIEGTEDKGRARAVYDRYVG